MRLLLYSSVRKVFDYNRRFFLQRNLHASIQEDKECFVEKLEGEDKGISIINLNRPRTKNAISQKLLMEFYDAIGKIRNESDNRVILLRSLVNNAFCSGADLKERDGMSPSDVTKFIQNLRRTFRELETLPIPTIAVIDGVALGGGLELALCCDLRVAGANAKIGLPETKLAIIPGAGGTQRLARVIGIAKAKELIYTGRILSPQDALDLGIVNYCAQEESSYPIALKLAREILPSGPIALRMAKLAIDRGSQLDLDSALEFENACYEQVIPTEDRIEGLKAFKDKRSPIYKGR
ncbi:41968_t:CDS:10 [Gigaspora margarita]|uniref:41968_t:CDS:1 n=2 Tax=Gigaspora margarita TaxID=4874 RepID=A0ABN7VGM8_GIGMA|nr:enoyl-CoA hydratase [Gigaspora margarita]CAG8769765.1 41968_t:CDS:10 [Gigaspora margarita]